MKTALSSLSHSTNTSHTVSNHLTSTMNVIQTNNSNTRILGFKGKNSLAILSTLGKVRENVCLEKSEKMSVWDLQFIKVSHAAFPQY